MRRLAQYPPPIRLFWLVGYYSVGDLIGSSFQHKPLGLFAWAVLLL